MDGQSLALVATAVGLFLLHPKGRRRALFGIESVLAALAWLPLQIVSLYWRRIFKPALNRVFRPNMQQYTARQQTNKRRARQAVKTRRDYEGTYVPADNDLPDWLRKATR